MNHLKTTILNHVGHNEPHMDWLIEPPSHLIDVSETHPLLTFCVHPGTRFGMGASIPMASASPHRSKYLDYEGPITDDRGSVTKVHEGFHEPALWTDGRIITTLYLNDMAPMMADMVWQNEKQWLCSLVPSTTMAW